MKEKLLGYGQTFAGMYEKDRPQVTTLSDYRLYNFKFEFGYVSMLVSLYEYPDIHRRLMDDMDDTETAIGRYIQELNSAYAKLAEPLSTVETIEEVKALDSEINRLEEHISNRTPAEKI